MNVIFFGKLALSCLVLILPTCFACAISYNDMLTRFLSWLAVAEGLVCIAFILALVWL